MSATQTRKAVERRKTKGLRKTGGPKSAQAKSGIPRVVIPSAAVQSAHHVQWPEAAKRTTKSPTEKPPAAPPRCAARMLWWRLRGRRPATWTSSESRWRATRRTSSETQGQIVGRAGNWGERKRGRRRGRGEFSPLLLFFPAPSPSAVVSARPIARPPHDLLLGLRGCEADDEGMEPDWWLEEWQRRKELSVSLWVETGRCSRTWCHGVGRRKSSAPVNWALPLTRKKFVAQGTGPSTNEIGRKLSVLEKLRRGQLGVGTRPHSWTAEWHHQPSGEPSW